MTGPVRWGVLGSTAQIFRLGLAPAMEASDTSTVVATASRSDPAATYRSYADLVADDAVEAVYVPLPNSLHQEWTVRAAEAGKHVLCEKPLACTAEEARRMADACAAAGVVLAEAYMTPFHPRSVHLREVVRSGRLGPLRFARTAFTGVLRRSDDHRWQAEMGGGVLLDVGIYCLAPLLQAAGRQPVDLRCSMVMTPSGVDTSTSGWLDFGDGFTASFECSFEAPERQRTEIVGTQAAVVVERTFTPGVDDTRVTVLGREGTEEEDAGGDDPYRLMLEHVVDVIRNGVPQQRTPEASIELLALLDRLRASATTVAARA